MTRSKFNFYFIKCVINYFYDINIINSVNNNNNQNLNERRRPLAFSPSETLQSKFSSRFGPLAFEELRKFKKRKYRISNKRWDFRFANNEHHFGLDYHKVLPTNTIIVFHLPGTMGKIKLDN